MTCFRPASKCLCTAFGDPLLLIAEASAFCARHCRWILHDLCDHWRQPNLDVEDVCDDSEAFVVYEFNDKGGLLCRASEGQKDGAGHNGEGDSARLALLRSQQWAIPPPCARVGEDSSVRCGLRRQMMQRIRGRVDRRQGECVIWGISFSFLRRFHRSKFLFNGHTTWSASRAFLERYIILSLTRDDARYRGGSKRSHRFSTQKLQSRWKHIDGVHPNTHPPRLQHLHSSESSPIDDTERIHTWVTQTLKSPASTG